MTEHNEQQMAAEIAKLAHTALEDKKGVDVNTLAVADKTVLADYFVIATGTSSTHVKALADEAEFKLKEAGYTCGHTEGHGEWILLDYHSVIVHVFTKAAREFYKLEKLWSGADVIESVEE